MNTQKLISEVISLPVNERAHIADSILKSLNQPEPDIDAQWAEVAKQRLEEINDGRVKAVPGKGVFERVWARFS